MTVDQFLRARARRRFEWGEWDCVQMAGEATEARTGNNPAAAYKGRYSTALGAARLIKREYGDYEDMLRAHGREVNSVEDFDIALFEDRDGTEGLAVMARGKAKALGKVGFKPISMSRVKSVWRLG